MTVYDNFSGAYRGATHEDVTGCFNPTFNGTNEQNTALNITQSGAAATVTGTFGNGFCTYNGTLSQAGQMGGSRRFVSCDSGDFGSFTIYETQGDNTDRPVVAGQRVPPFRYERPLHNSHRAIEA